MDNNSESSDQMQFVDECNQNGLEDSREDIFSILELASKTQLELMSQISEDFYCEEAFTPVPQIMADQMYNLLDKDDQGFINQTIFLEAQLEEVHMEHDNTIMQKMTLLPETLNFNHMVQLTKEEFAVATQYLSMIWSMFKIFEEWEPNFDESTLVSSDVLKKKGIAHINSNLLGNKSIKVNYNELYDYIISFLNSWVGKHQSKMGLKLYVKLFSWVKFFLGDSVQEKINKEKKEALDHLEDIGMGEEQEQRFNDELTDQLDDEMRKMNQQWKAGTIMDKLMVMDLREATTEAEIDIECHDLLTYNAKSTSHDSPKKISRLSSLDKRIDKLHTAKKLSHQDTSEFNLENDIMNCQNNAKDVFQSQINHDEQNMASILNEGESNKNDSIINQTTGMTSFNTVEYNVENDTELSQMIKDSMKELSEMKLLLTTI